MPTPASRSQAHNVDAALGGAEDGSAKMEVDDEARGLLESDTEGEKESKEELAQRITEWEREMEGLGLLLPIKDMAKAWDVNVGDDINRYMESMKDIFDEAQSVASATKINWPLAAKIIGKSSEHYSKKVEALHDGVYKTLENLVTRTKGQKGAYKSKKQSALTEELDTEFLCDLLPYIKKGKNIDLDEDELNENANREVQLRRVPLWLMPREENDRRRKEFKVSSCSVHPSGTFLLLEQDMGHMDLPKNDMDTDIPDTTALVPPPNQPIFEMKEELDQLRQQLQAEGIGRGELITPRREGEDGTGAKGEKGPGGEQSGGVGADSAKKSAGPASSAKPGMTPAKSQEPEKQDIQKTPGGTEAVTPGAVTPGGPATPGGLTTGGATPGGANGDGAMPPSQTPGTQMGPPATAPDTAKKGPPDAAFPPSPRVAPLAPAWERNSWWKLLDPYDPNATIPKPLVDGNTHKLPIPQLMWGPEEISKTREEDGVDDWNVVCKTGLECSNEAAAFVKHACCQAPSDDIFKHALTGTAPRKHVAISMGFSADFAAQYEDLFQQEQKKRRANQRKIAKQQQIDAERLRAEAEARLAAGEGLFGGFRGEGHNSSDPFAGGLNESIMHHGRPFSPAKDLPGGAPGGAASPVDAGAAAEEAYFAAAAAAHNDDAPVDPFFEPGGEAVDLEAELEADVEPDGGGAFDVNGLGGTRGTHGGSAAFAGTMRGGGARTQGVDMRDPVAAARVNGMQQRAEQLRLELAASEKGYHDQVNKHLAKVSDENGKSAGDDLNNIYQVVQKWQDDIEPVLAEDAKRNDFDFGQYGQNMVSKLSAFGKGSLVDFKQVCEPSRPRYEACREFLTSLILANKENVEIVKDPQNKVGFSLKLLKPELDVVELYKAGTAAPPPEDPAGKGKKNNKAAAEVETEAPEPVGEEYNGQPEVEGVHEDAPLPSPRVKSGGATSSKSKPAPAGVRASAAAKVGPSTSSSSTSMKRAAPGSKNKKKNEDKLQLTDDLDDVFADQEDDLLADDDQDTSAKRKKTAPGKKGPRK
ncbi:unnamed protein product [Amoebophrya sp. A25]|nr:unnamed protein product [Amoebophrya sp. A25]|eukprot:GSA25T00007653001.1